MKHPESQPEDDEDIEHDPADLPNPDDTEDVAIAKLARRMARIMEIPADEIMPKLRRLTIAEQLRQEELISSDSPVPPDEANSW